MISYNPKNWFGIIFHFHKSDTLSKMKWVLIPFMVYTWAFVYVELHHKDWFQFKSTIQIHSLLGFVLGLLLVFRTNTAYDRWWEGRIKWGELVNNTRNFAIKLSAVLPENSKWKSYFSGMINNYVVSMKQHLRDDNSIENINSIDGFSTSDLVGKTHIPNNISAHMYKVLHKLYNEKVISGDQLITLDKELKAFTDIIGACERIKNTPMPYSYSMFLKKFIFVYTITMPLGMAFDFNYWTVPIATAILYVLGSLELLAEEIEDPFGKDVNDLPVDSLTAKIKENVEEILK